MNPDPSNPAGPTEEQFRAALHGATVIKQMNELLNEWSINDPRDYVSFWSFALPKLRELASNPAGPVAAGEASLPPLQRLLNYCDDADASGYGALISNIVRNCVKEELALAEQAMNEAVKNLSARAALAQAPAATVEVPECNREFGPALKAMDATELQEFCIALSLEQDDYTEEVIRRVEDKMLGKPLFVPAAPKHPDSAERT